jgi:hypothetical protein
MVIINYSIVGITVIPLLIKMIFKKVESVKYHSRALVMARMEKSVVALKSSFYLTVECDMHIILPNCGDASNG